MQVRECEAIAIPRWIHREKFQKKEHRNCRNVVLIQGQGGDAAGIDSGGGGDGSGSAAQTTVYSSLRFPIWFWFSVIYLLLLVFLLILVIAYYLESYSFSE